MNLLEFLLPVGFFRKRAAELVWTQIQRATQMYPQAEISIIAHSFGTFIVAHLLQKQFMLKLNRIIFCGSVLRFDFPFEQINSRFNSPILMKSAPQILGLLLPRVSQLVTVGRHLRF